MKLQLVNHVDSKSQKQVVNTCGWAIYSPEPHCKTGATDATSIRRAYDINNRFPVDLRKMIIPTRRSSVCEDIVPSGLRSPD